VAKKKPVKKVKRSKGKSKPKELSKKELRALLPDLDLQIVSLKKLRRWKINPRENEQAAPRLAATIKKNGFRVPIITTPDYRIWAGDTRYQAAKLLGMPKVPVLVTEFEAEAKAMMFALAENKSSEWARWDPDRLESVFQKNRSVDMSDLQDMSGFSAIEIQKLRGTGDLPDMPEGFGAGELASPLDPTELEGKDDTWYRIVITCKDDAEKKELHRLLGIKGKKTVYTLADLKVEGHRKPVKKRKIKS
jgi:hypothetical protein